MEFKNIKQTNNDDKTAIVVIRKKKSEETLTINIANEEIEESKKERLLGIIIDQSLKWDSHIKTLVRKLNFRLFTLRRLNEKLSNFYISNEVSL